MIIAIMVGMNSDMDLTHAEKASYDSDMGPRHAAKVIGDSDKDT